MTDKILIVDFGSQFTQLISRRLRELNILSNSIRPEVLTKFDFDKVKGIILSGGPNSVLLINKKHREILEIIFEKRFSFIEFERPDSGHDTIETSGTILFGIGIVF